MGTFSVTLQVIGPDGQVEVKALVDTGATYTMLPRPLLERLGITSMDRMRFRLADERAVTYPVGEALVAINGRRRTTVVVFGQPEMSPVLGSVTLESFGLGVDTVNQRLVEIEALLKPSQGMRESTRFKDA